MDSLQTMALIAAAVNKQLRASLEEDWFDPRVKSLVSSLKDGRQRDSRERVRQWLKDSGVLWDGKSDIGSAIIEALRAKTAKENLGRTVQSLRLRMASGLISEEKAREATAFLEGLINGDGQQGASAGDADTRPGGEVHRGKQGGL